MKQLFSAAVLGASLMMNVCHADETGTLTGESDRISYLGYQMGGDFKRQGVEINREALIQGIRDAQSHAEPLMKPEEMQSTLVELIAWIIGVRVCAGTSAVPMRMRCGKCSGRGIKTRGPRWLAE
jgi:hypothetical protein